MQKQLTPKQKIEAVIQTLDGVRGGQIEPEFGLENLAKLNVAELNSDIGKFIGDATAIVQSYQLRPVAERQTPVLDNALLGLKHRATPFLATED